MTYTFEAEKRLAMQELSIEEIQAINLETLAHFAQYCEDHGLMYYLIGGSLIGAIRDGNLVPWDDDIDVALRRSDYDRLCSEYEDSEQYTLLEYRRNPDYRYGMAKLSNNNTIYDENIVEKHEGLGAFIDIFPLDSIDASNKAMLRTKLTLKKLYILAYNLNSEAVRNRPVKRFLKFLIKMMLAPVGQRRILAWLQTTLKGNCQGDSYINWWGAWGERECCPKRCFSSVTSVWLGDKLFNAPSGYDYWLKKIYGDYLTPPTNPAPSHGVVYWR